MLIGLKTTCPNTYNNNNDGFFSSVQRACDNSVNNRDNEVEGFLATHHSARAGIVQHVQRDHCVVLRYTRIPHTVCRLLIRRSTWLNEKKKK